MISKDSMMRGLMAYLDDEVIPKLPTSGKWVMGTMLTIAEPKAEHIADAMLTNPIVRAIEVVDENGMIDDIKLIEGLAKSAQKYGCLELDIPIVGTMRFSSQDVVSLGEHMRSRYS